MRKNSEPRFVLEARLRLTEAKSRAVRQERRVGRLKREGRDASDARKLLTKLQRRQRRSQQYLDMVLGWSRRHIRRKFPRPLRARFVGPKAAQESEEQRRARWDRDVRAFLEWQHPEAPNYRASLLALWEKFVALKLPTEHFVTEFTSGKKSVVLQRAWEMMLARHLDAQGFAISTAPEGPDFRFEHGGRTYWVEAVSPEPMGVPEDYLVIGPPSSGPVGMLIETRPLR
jgi:hypothetical protein